MTAAERQDRASVAYSPIGSVPGPLECPPTAEAGQAATSETTRLLCAGAYLDESYCSAVRELIRRTRHRAVAPSYGVDARMVAGHCLAAARRRAGRQRLKVGAAVGGAVGALALAGGEFPVLVFVGAWGLAAVVYFADRWYTRRVIVARQFSRRTFAGGAPPRAPRLPARLARHVEAAVRAGEGNVSVYQGFVPFVGAGTLVNAWSFAVNLQQGKRDAVRGAATPQPCRIDEMYESLRERVTSLGVPGLVVEDRLFVSGLDVRTEDTILPPGSTRPVDRVEAQVMKLYAEGASPHARYYMCFRVTDWSGELVLSIFVRMRDIGGNLFVEASYFLLAPAKEDYRVADARSGYATIEGLFSELTFAVLATPFVLLGATLRALNFVPTRIREVLDEHSIEKRARLDGGYDFGADASLRQLGSASDVRRYFQRLDKEMYLKVLERRILDALVDYLDAHDVDTSELRERQSTILNNGVIVTGTVQARNFVAGNKASALVKQVQRSVGGGFRGAAPASGGTSTASASV